MDVDMGMVTDMDTDIDMDIDLDKTIATKMNMDTDMSTDMNTVCMDMDIGILHKDLLLLNYVCRKIVTTNYFVITMSSNFVKLKALKQNIDSIVSEKRNYYVVIVT